MIFVNQSNRKLIQKTFLFDDLGELLNITSLFIGQFFPFFKINSFNITKNLNLFDYANYSTSVFDQIHISDFIFTKNVKTFIYLIKYFSDSCFTISSNIFNKKIYIDDTKTIKDFSINDFEKNEIALNSSALLYFLASLQEKDNLFISSFDKKIFLICDKIFQKDFNLFADFISAKIPYNVINTKYTNNKKLLSIKFFFENNTKVSFFVNELKQKINLNKYKLSRVLNNQNIELYPLLINWHIDSYFFNLMIEKIDSTSFNSKDLNEVFDQLLNFFPLIGYEFLDKIDYTHLL